MSIVIYNIIALSAVDCFVLLSFVSYTTVRNFVDKTDDNFYWLNTFTRTATEHSRLTNIWMTVCISYERYNVICKLAVIDDNTMKCIIARIFTVFSVFSDCTYWVLRYCRIPVPRDTGLPYNI